MINVRSSPLRCFQDHGVTTHTHSGLPVKYDEGFYDKLEHDDNRFGFVAKHNDKIVGVITIRMRNESLFWPFITSNKMIGYIMTMSVLPSFRRKGIASALLKTLTRRCIEKFENFRLELHCLQDNTAAIQLYKQHGFKHRESLSDHYYFHGDFHDAYLLSQDLGNARPDITLGESTRSLAASSFRKFENMATYLQDQFLGCLR